MQQKQNLKFKLEFYCIIYRKILPKNSETRLRNIDPGHKFNFNESSFDYKALVKIQ